ncbi:MAG: hypothetical protein M3478_14205, partial [Planctomycetota bacterium]|nr:hypothetical protein [Planctomycetota bacterium]
MDLRGTFVALLGFALSTPITLAQSPSERPVDFNRDVRPILSENCFTCHGPDKNKRKADLRLDTKEGVFSTPDELPIVVPGKPGDSAMFQRISTDDKDEVMPPSKTGKALKPEQVA